MKRILVLSLALILAVGSLAVPSYAAESSVHSTVDLMQAVSYDLYRNGTYSKSFFGSTSEAWLNNSTSAAWVWSSPHTGKFDSMVVTIAARSQPSSFVYYDPSGNNRTGTLVGKKSAGAVTYFQYTFGSSTAAAGFKFEATWSSNYTGEFMIVSAFGNLENTVSFSNVSYFANAILYHSVSDGLESPPEDEIRHPLSVASSSSSQLPVIVDFPGPTGSDFYSMEYGEVFLKLPFTDSFKYFDSVSYLVYTAGEILSSGSRLESPEGHVVDGLSFDIEYCGETQMLFELEENFHRLQCYVITVDTKGLDLSDKVLTLQLNIDRVFGSYIYQYDFGFYFQCSSIVGKYDVNDIPWYAHFGLWLEGVLSENNNSLLAALSDGFSYVSQFTWSQVNFIKDFLTGKFDQIISILQGKDAQDMQQDVQDQIDDFEHMDDVINSITTPNVDNIDTDISYFVSTDQLTSVQDVFGRLFGIKFLMDFVSLSLILGLGSFLVYGRKD